MLHMWRLTRRQLVKSSEKPENEPNPTALVAASCGHVRVCGGEERIGTTISFMESVFSDLQKAFLCLAPLGPAAIWAGTYAFARKKIPTKRSENEMLSPLYACVAGLLLGQLLGHVLPNALLGDYRELKFGCIGLGVLSIIFMYRLFRVCGPAGSEGVLVGDFGPLSDPEAVLDSSSQEERPYVVVDGTQRFSDQVLPVLRAELSLRLTRRVGLVIYTASLYSQVMEGFLLPYNPRDSSPGGLIAAFWITKCMQAFCMAGYAVYSRLHRQQSTGRVKALYLLMAALWCIAVFLSCLPVLLDLPMATLEQVVLHPASGVFYALSGGMILVISFLFLFLSPREPEWPRTLLFLAIMTASAALMWLTGLWI